jgi:hypothetical protein
MIKPVKKKKPQTETARYRIKSVLQRLWMWSPERRNRLKFDNYQCVQCKAKQSKAKGKEVSLNVHHIKETDWKRIQDVIYEELFVSLDKLECLCKDCHLLYHHEQHHKN